MPLDTVPTVPKKKQPPTLKQAQSDNSPVSITLPRKAWAELVRHLEAAVYEEFPDMTDLVMVKSYLDRATQIRHDAGIRADWPVKRPAMVVAANKCRRENR